MVGWPWAGRGLWARGWSWARGHCHGHGHEHGQGPRPRGPRPPGPRPPGQGLDPGGFLRLCSFTSQSSFAPQGFLGHEAFLFNKLLRSSMLLVLKLKKATSEMAGNGRTWWGLALGVAAGQFCWPWLARGPLFGRFWLVWAGLWPASGPQGLGPRVDQARESTKATENFIFPERSARARANRAHSREARILFGLQSATPQGCLYSTRLPLLHEAAFIPRRCLQSTRLRHLNTHHPQVFFFTAQTCTRHAAFARVYPIDKEGQPIDGNVKEKAKLSQLTEMHKN